MTWNNLGSFFREKINSVKLKIFDGFKKSDFDFCEKMFRKLLGGQVIQDQGKGDYFCDFDEIFVKSFSVGK